MRKLISIFVLLGAFVSTQTFAQATLSCTGKVSMVGVNFDGHLYASTGYGVWSICSMTTTERGVVPAACKGWLLSLLSSKANRADATIYVSGYTSCRSVGSGVIANAYFVN